MPIEAAKKFGTIEVTGEMGYGIVQHGQDEWEYGILFARPLSSRLELMGELHGATLRDFRKDALLFNVGSRVQISKNTVLLLSAGRTIRTSDGNGPQIIAALGIQINFRHPMPGLSRDK